MSAYINISKKKKTQTDYWEKKKTLGLDKSKALYNKCCNIFSKYLFLVVVGHSLIFYYFISACKKLAHQ